MALADIQKDMARQKMAAARGGDKSAQGFLDTIKAQTDPGSIEFAAFIKELESDSTNPATATLLNGINLIDVQVAAARSNLLKARAGDSEAILFWQVIDMNAARLDPVAREFQKARVQLEAGMNTGAAPTMPDMVGITSIVAQQIPMGETLAQIAARLAPTAVAAPAPVQPPTASIPVSGQASLPFASTPNAESVAFLESINKAVAQIESAKRDILATALEIFEARDVILKAIGAAPPAPLPSTAPELPHTESAASGIAPTPTSV
jgi:hypothetical protein